MTKPPRVLADKIAKVMRFTFVGNVTRVPVKGSLPLTTVFGQQFYITAGNLGSFTSSDAWVPAWVIPVDEKKANLEYSVVQVPYEFKWTSFMKTETVQTKLSIFCLTPKKQFIDAKNVELFRPAMKEQLKAVPKEKPKASAKAKARSKRTEEDSAELKAVRHLLK